MAVVFPEGYCLQTYSKKPNRTSFDCGSAPVNQWLKKRASQAVKAQHAGVRLLVYEADQSVVGFYAMRQIALATKGVSAELLRRNENELASATLISWIGVDKGHNGKELGTRLLAQALNDAALVQTTCPSSGVIVDALSETNAKHYRSWGFVDLPEHPLRLILSAKALLAMAKL